MALTDSLVEYWPLDESSGTRTGLHASLALTDNNTVASATGLVYALAADFEKVNANESLTRTSDSNTQAGDIDLTIGAWVKIETAESFQGIVIKGDGTNGEYALYYDHSITKFTFKVWGGLAFASETQVDSTTFGAPSNGVWYLVVCSHDATNNQISLSVNAGTPDTAAHTTGIVASGGAFQIGSYNFFSWWFDGLLGPVMLWKRVLTSDERSQIWNGGSGLAYADFDVGRTFVLNRV